MHDLNLHLGDNAGYTGFPDSTYAGLRAEIPVILQNPTGDEASLTLTTTSVETYAPWQSHAVRLDGYLLGYLRDEGMAADERFEFPLPADLIDGTPRRLTVEVGARDPGLIDDFVLRGGRGGRVRAEGRVGVRGGVSTKPHNPSARRSWGSVVP